MTEALIRLDSIRDYPADRERGWPAQTSVTYQAGGCQVGFFVRPASVIRTREGGAFLRVTITHQTPQWVHFLVDSCWGTADLGSVVATKG